MFEYEMHQVHSAELIQRAEAYRLARTARAAAKAHRAERRSAGHDAEGGVSTNGPRRHRAPRAA
ncbi:hypothetical protein ACIREE_22815 [Streptomyces sp. NPDC102467]|uniref:hypothetical protein n=1 Tax=Streptomyces sp. NPDC102467 TaxID=3366179 RepID=UPI0038254EE9